MKKFPPKAAEISSPPFNSELDEANRQLREATAQFQAMWEQGLFAGRLDLHGLVLDVNHSSVEGCGFVRQEILGKPFWECGWWNRDPEVQRWVRRAVEQAIAGEAFRGDSPYFVGDGSERVVDFASMPIKDAAGRVIFVVVTGMDITERVGAERDRRALEEERQHAEALRKLDELKTQFFANISHEFRTPLTLILAPLEDALANTYGALPEVAATELAMAHRNGLRLLKLVNTMLDFARIEAGRVQAHFEPTELGVLTAELASNFQSLCERAGLRLTVNCAPLAGGDLAHVDRDLWEKIVLNLISNAFKFTLEGEIEVRLETRDGRAVLQVRDTGVGIAAEELLHVFERFHRIEQRGGRTHEGTGIGLALVEELVKLHGGTVSVESAVGRGSTFTVSIPLAKEHLVPARAGRPASTAVTPAAFVEEAQRWLPDEPAGEDRAAEKDAETFAGPKPRVLWADDNADMRAHVSRLLSGRFDVEAVNDGAAALEAARARKPDLILSDVMMPRMDGSELLRALRADPELRDIPVILLSARAGEESRIESLEAGADDYLIKPFSARELVARVDANVKISQMRQQAEAALRDSEQRFRRFANEAPAILWITEADGTCSFISRAWYEYSDQSEDAALGFGWLEMLHPADRDQARDAFLEANERGEAFSLVARVRRADGEFRWVLSSGRPRVNARGEFAGYTASMVDVHERNEEARAAALLGAIVDSCDDAIISKNLNGVITSWNRGAERLFGYTADEAVGRSIEMLIPPERLHEEPKILSDLRRGQRVDHFETIRVHKNGTRLNISVTISPIRDSSGRIVGASKVARDITDKVRHEEALEAANTALKRANADLEQFAYSASHDLQEPLRMVAAYSQLLQKRFGGQLGPTGDEIIGHTVQGALRMERLLRDLRMYTQVSASEEEPPEEVDADEILKRTLTSLQVAIGDSGATVSSTELPRVYIHEFQLEQLFQNLISNAIRYRSADPPRIRVSAEREGREWRFSVEDNGIGIDPRFQSQVFGIFKRLHSASEYPGTGMGLAICKRIVERAGGRIWVESELGGGSTFYFTVPSTAPLREKTGAVSGRISSGSGGG
jgi:PAS domain S-box-containing protein